jgi:hypothetical protein
MFIPVWIIIGFIALFLVLILMVIYLMLNWPRI